MNIEQMSFDWLINPITSADFIQNYWEKKPLLVCRSTDDYFDGLLSLTDIDYAISVLNLKHPDIRVVNSKVDFDKTAYTYETGEINSLRVFQLLAEGSTVILNRLDKRL